MVIDLNAMLRGEIRSLAVDCAVTCDSAPDGITLLPGAALIGTIEDSGGYIRLTSKASIPYSGFCARCLDTVTGTLEFDFNRTLVTEGTLSDEQLEEEADEYMLIRDGVLAPDEAIAESVWLEFPMTLLCSDDCMGLCPVCGKKRAEGCNCNTAETDPRWAKLAAMFDNDRENK